MAAVRKEVQAIDPDQPVFNLRTMDQMMKNMMWPYRVFGTLFTIFAFIGLMLSAVGLYAVMAYAVTQRTQEIGVRMALGAQGSQVTWMVLKRGLFQLGLGLAFGLAGGYLRRARAAVADPRPHHGDRSVDVRRDHAAAQHRRDHRVPGSRPPRDARRSAGRAAGGVKDLRSLPAEAGSHTSDLMPWLPDVMAVPV